MTPLSAVSKCTDKSRSVASRMYPLRCLVANGANFTVVVRANEELYGDERGSGCGPWTVHEILSAEVEGRNGEVFLVDGGVASSR